MNSSVPSLATPPDAALSALIVDHACTDLHKIPSAEILRAQGQLKIAYGHTSHGSQLVSGLQTLQEAAPTLGISGDYKIGPGGLDLRDRPFNGANDLGNPNRTAWADATREYLKQTPDVNVVMWSWCGQAGWSNDTEIELYLKLMADLENEFSQVRFVYMTGHLDGSGLEGKLNRSNEQIREFCVKNGKVLFDFADIESYDPDGEVNYAAKAANDNCDYDSNGDGTRDKNWAIDWQNANPGKWWQSDAAHSQPLNANRKAIASWWLFARLAGWSGK